MISSHSKAVEDYGRTLVAEKIAERNIELAQTMILKEKYSVEEISELTGLKKTEVMKLVEKIKDSANS